MTIAQYQTAEFAGTRVYAPEGPYAPGGVFQSFKPGQTVKGDSSSEFTFLTLTVTSSLTLNQGDFLCWDNSYNASLVGEVIAASEYFPGTAAGTFFLGGGVANPAAFPAAGNQWSFTFAPGVYGIWVQCCGTSLMNLGALSTGATLTNPNTTSAKGRITMQAAAALTTFSSAPVGTICNCPLSRTFTGTTTNASNKITAINTAKFLVRGMQLTGLGIPAVGAAQPGTFILDILGDAIVMSNNATSTNAGATITALNSQTTGNVTNASKLIKNVPQIPGLYPNQIITGTGAVSLTIKSIQGTPGNYTIELTAAATATNNNVQITLAAAPNYYEGFIRAPYFNIAL